jgi:integrase
LKHLAAMPYDDVPAFMARLRATEGVAPRAVEFTILTAARSGEVRGATWSEIDLEGKVWTIPAERMKAGREHRVPLSKRAVAVLREAEKMRMHAGPDALVFPGLREGRPLSDMSLTAVLRRLEIDVTVHGFRSSFRDWAGDCTAFPRDLIEQALAHVIADKTEAAYRRSDALERRREVMEAWAGHCEPKAANVVRMPRQR